MPQNLFLSSILTLSILILTACGGNISAQRSGSENASDSPQAQEATIPEEPIAAGDPEAGKEIFVATCGACHGPAGEGVTGLGKDMTGSDFIRATSDTELVEFIKMGRDPSDPLNTTGVAMPVKGGNPALDDEDLLNVVSYIRTLQK